MLPCAVRLHSGPTPHGGRTALMLLCGRIRERSKVVLTGEGADELFCGYLRMPYGARRCGRSAVPPILPGICPGRTDGPLPVCSALRGLDAAAYSAVYHDFRAVAHIFPGLLPKPARARRPARATDFRDRLFAIDQARISSHCLSVQDKMSMAQSVEGARSLCVPASLP